MTTTPVSETQWYPEKKLLVTRLSGELETKDIEVWESSLKNALEQMEENTSFKIFINIHGFKAANMDAHKRFRSIVPLTLADYGWKVGYVNMFEEEAKTMTFKNIRGISCVAAAHSHQDETKMELYETRFSSEKEHFFQDPEQARQWIEALDIAS